MIQQELDTKSRDFKHRFYHILQKIPSTSSDKRRS